MIKGNYRFNFGSLKYYAGSSGSFGGGGAWRRLGITQALHDSIVPFDALFIETNPIPVKAVMAAGWIEECTVPLCTMEPEHRAQLLELYEGVRG